MLNTARPAVRVRATAVEGPCAEHFALASCYLPQLATWRKFSCVCCYSNSWFNVFTCSWIVVFTSCFNSSFVRVSRYMSSFEIRLLGCINLDNTHYLFIFRMCYGHRKPLASYAFLSCMILCDICHVGVWLCAPNSLAVRCPKETTRFAVLLLQEYLCLRFGCKVRSSGDIHIACFNVDCSCLISYDGTIIQKLRGTAGLWGQFNQTPV
jgi:hypothetical protein